MKSVIRLSLLASLIMMLLSSCLDDDSDSVVTNNFAAGLVYNASPDSGGLYFFADGNQVNSQVFEYDEGNGYYRFFTGNREVRVLSETGAELASMNLQMQIGQYYSIFAVDSFSEISVLALEDDLDFPAAGKFWIRFVHLSPDAPQVNFEVGEESLGNFNFKDFSEFMPMDAGTYDLSIKDMEGNTVLVQESVNLRAGNIYTYFAGGFVGADSGASNALSINRIINYQN